MKIEGAMLLHGDCLELMRTLDDCSVDAVVTDPPYGLKFMGRKLDCSVPGVEVWAECLRVLKPGGHLLAFAGTRTQHRMAVNIEDAGFEIRDMIAWVYGSGFPKSMDVSKAIDKAAGAEREVVGEDPWANHHREPRGNSIYGSDATSSNRPVTAPSTEEAKQWQGWGTALKPALEPITVARKPMAGTVTENVLEHGTGALNVDGCRIGDTVETWPSSRARPADGQPNAIYTHKLEGNDQTQTIATGPAPAGRFPSNLIHDGSDDVMRLFPETKSGARNGKECANGHTTQPYSGGYKGYTTAPHGVSAGSAARFFYCAKASGEDREGNAHLTVKPTDLMRYLCRLVTPPNGTVLDPFMGSGSTGVAALLEGFRFIGMEREAEYMRIAEQRISSRTRCIQRRLF
jgi:site-specific DNA-methyltransferase (adenine-specific)